MREYLDDVLVVKHHGFEEFDLIFVHLHHLELGHTDIVEKHGLELLNLLLLVRVSNINLTAWLRWAKGVGGLLHLVLQHQNHGVDVVVIDLWSLFSLR